MGVLSDLVPGTDADIPRIFAAGNPAHSFAGIDIKGIDSVRLAELHAVVSGTKVKALLDQYEPLPLTPDDERWLFRVPAALTEALAVLAPEQREDVARRWAQCESMASDDWGNDVCEVLDAIADLASRTIASGKGLFLWMSL
jgi:hypothetical protein